jgi:ABC-type nickel/cobalt efflux system permease component RcnA
VSLSHTIGILALASLVVGARGILNPDVLVRGAPIVAALAIVAIGAWMLISELRRNAARRAHAHAPDPHEHTHGGTRHSHATTGATTITWRSLFVLGLAGGIIPSTSALLILLGAIASGRAAFGMVLVVAFGVGMALVMTGIGLLVVGARGRLDSVGTSTAFGWVRRWLPLAAAVLVLGLGIYLSAQAVAAPPTL